jgi:hypothetical protein
MGRFEIGSQILNQVGRPLRMVALAFSSVEAASTGAFSFLGRSGFQPRWLFADFDTASRLEAAPTLKRN